MKNFEHTIQLGIACVLLALTLHEVKRCYHVLVRIEHAIHEEAMR